MRSGTRSIFLPLVFAIRVLPLVGQSQDSAPLLKLKIQQNQEQKNLEIVMSFWKDIWEDRKVALAPKYISENYLDHNPNMQNGRDSFMKAFGRPLPANSSRTRATTVMTFTKDDMVILIQEREGPDPRDPSKTYKWSWLEMFRMADGLIQEHWDSSVRRP